MMTVPGNDFLEQYREVRSRTMALCAPLRTEDYVVQSMEDASPARWHLAHTTWFFETFVIGPHGPRLGVSYTSPDPRYAYVFNSYYNGVGAQFPRAQRGTLSRPTVDEVKTWRAQVDEAVIALIQTGDPEVLCVVEIGLHHEEQHQELLVTDIKHALLSNPLWPVYDPDKAQIAPPQQVPAPGRWFEGGMIRVGHEGEGYCFDSETPVHDAWVGPFHLAGELVTCGEWLAFMEDGGYTRHDLWLSDGWATVQQSGWVSPLYWIKEDDGWSELTLGGKRPLPLGAPVAHISFFEADAYARWAGARLPTEFEWEHAADVVGASLDGTFMDDGVLHPVGAVCGPSGGLRHMLGEVWEWTASAYRPYPGYAPPPGALGEYNGKFMNGLYVLRGGSCATPRRHVRTTYRNFFGPDKRWQFTGLRLAWDKERT